MVEESKTRFKNGLPTAVGLVGGLIVTLTYSAVGGLQGVGLSATLILYTLAAGGITLGLLAGKKIMNSRRTITA